MMDYLTIFDKYKYTFNYQSYSHSAFPNLKYQTCRLGGLHKYANRILPQISGAVYTVPW